MIKSMIIILIFFVISSLSLGYNNNKYSSSLLLKSSLSLIKKTSTSSTSTLLYNHNNNDNNNNNNIKTISLNQSIKSVLISLPIFNIKKTLLLFFNAIVIFIITLIKPNKVLAATTTINKISGWDLFGRMPLDDWLFRTWALCDPNLLKKSYVEAIVFELPDIMANFKRRKRINEIITLGKGFGYLIGAICIAGIMYKGVLASQLRKVNQKGSDNYIPTSAISKKASRKGKQIDNMEGWLDMEQDADDDNDDNDNSKDSSKKKKRKDDDDDDED